MGPSHSTSLFAITLHNVVSRQDRYALYCVHDIDLRWCMISAKADAAVLSTFHYHMVLAPVFICAEEVTKFSVRKSILASPKAKKSNSLHEPSSFTNSFIISPNLCALHYGPHIGR